MDKKTLAALLSGRKIGDEITDEQVKIARDNGLVVLFGASDDLVELEGAIRDEVGAYGDNNLVLFYKGDLYSTQCEADECPHEMAIQDKCKTIKAIFGGDISWTYETEIPHETFDIYEGDEIYCRGLVFSVEDIK